MDLEVTHVYKGSQELLGMTFVIWTPTPKSQSSNAIIHFSPSLKKGEKVISLLRTGAELLAVPGMLTVPSDYELRKVGYVGPLIALPAREDKQRGLLAHGELLAWAKAVEAASKALPATRYELLKKDALSDSRVVAPWALALLNKASPSDAAAYCRELMTRPDVKVWQKVIADGAFLHDPSGKEWRRSPERLRLYRSWTREAKSDADAEELGSMLQQMKTGGEVSFNDWFDLIKAVADNKQLQARREARLFCW